MLYSVYIHLLHLKANIAKNNSMQKSVWAAVYTNFAYVRHGKTPPKKLCETT